MLVAGAIHFHALVFQSNVTRLIGASIDTLLAQGGMKAVEVQESKIAGELRSLMGAVCIPTSAEHPAGRTSTHQHTDADMGADADADGACQGESSWSKRRALCFKCGADLCVEDYDIAVADLNCPQFVAGQVRVSADVRVRTLDAARASVLEKGEHALHKVRSAVARFGASPTDGCSTQIKEIWEFLQNVLPASRAACDANGDQAAATDKMFKAAFDAREHMVGDHSVRDVKQTHIGDASKWPRPEGCAGAVPSRGLRLKLFRIPNTAAAELQDRIDMCNRVLLHNCSSYCLRYIEVHGATKCTCRFGYGFENKAAASRSDGKKVRACDALVSDEGGVTKLEAARDHPRLVQGSLLLAVCYRGNYDWQQTVAPTRDAFDAPFDVDAVLRDFVGEAEADAVQKRDAALLADDDGRAAATAAAMAARDRAVNMKRVCDEFAEAQQLETMISAARKSAADAGKAAVAAATQVTLAKTAHAIAVANALAANAAVAMLDAVEAALVAAAVAAARVAETLAVVATTEAESARTATIADDSRQLAVELEDDRADVSVQQHTERVEMWATARARAFALRGGDVESVTTWGAKRCSAFTSLPVAFRKEVREMYKQRPGVFNRDACCKSLVDYIGARCVCQCVCTSACDCALIGILNLRFGFCLVQSRTLAKAR